MFLSYLFPLLEIFKNFSDKILKKDRQKNSLPVLIRCNLGLNLHLRLGHSYLPYQVRLEWVQNLSLVFFSHWCYKLTVAETIFIYMQIWIIYFKL